MKIDGVMLGFIDSIFINFSIDYLKIASSNSAL